MSGQVPSMSPLGAQSHLIPPPIPGTSTTPPGNLVQEWPDLGLTLICDFISPAEEQEMISSFHAISPLNPADTKRRISQHFGHHFDYTTFGIDESKHSPVPSYITNFLDRLPVDTEGKEMGRKPDQFTVQYYPPGAGIPPHVDTHSMFGEALYSLSFGSGVPMIFRMSGENEARKLRLPKRSLQESSQAGLDASADGKAADEKSEKAEGVVAHPAWELMLPARSLLVMRGASRYGYTHGIRPRKTDVVDGVTVRREGRYSITMRSVRRGEEIGCDCPFPGVCDARVRKEQEAAAIVENTEMAGTECHMNSP
ncbi:hypothetical protein B0T21DRAFT_377056 [Apiosordaria backusii]|uniref:Fe2OG dioxygenase domain-containing protein n=1 Tax=Apiosordaria backusii TaxID=314023 RepID=A0AA40DR05_9PEZI|nr:hypothetical protein B0T21DRAFT_377056 [Apiosordaria backusii]